MRHIGTDFVLLALLATESCSAFLSYIAVPSSNVAPNVRRANINMQATWRGLFDGVMGRAEQKEGNGSGILTPKSRVKLGDLSVSPMGKLSCRALGTLGIF